MKYLFLIITIAVVLGILLIATFSKFKLSNEQYDNLKAVVLKWHYLVVFIALIVKTFDVQYGIETVTIVSGIGAMLAGLMGISSANYTGDKMTAMFNEDLLKDMLGYTEDLHHMGEAESEEEVTESED